MFASKPPTCTGRTLDLSRKDSDIRYLRHLGNSDIAKLFPERRASIVVGTSIQSLVPVPVQLLLLLRVRLLSWRRRLAATLRKPSELAGVLVALAVFSYITVRAWRVDWTANVPAVVRLFAWYIVILTGIGVVLRVGQILRKGAGPLEPWEALGGSSEVDRLVDLVFWAARFGVLYGVLFLQLAPAVAAGSPIATRLVAIAPGLWISGVVLGEWAGLIVSILASLVARLRVPRSVSLVAAMGLGLAIAWPFAAQTGQLVEMAVIAAQGNEIPWRYSLWAVPLGFFAVMGSAFFWRGLGKWMTLSGTYATDLGLDAFRGSGSLMWTGALLATRTMWPKMLLAGVAGVVVGVISVGVEELDGKPQAILFVGFLTSAFLWLFSRQMRDQLTPQHRFLREQPGSLTRADWRQLVAGQAVVPGILGAAVYLCQGRSKSRPRWRRKTRPPGRWGGVSESGCAGGRSQDAGAAAGRRAFLLWARR